MLIRELVIAVFSVSGRLAETGNELVKPIGLTTAWWQVLGALGYSPAPLPVAHIARNMGLTRQAVQRVVELLAQQGFVVFETNPHHARARLVVLTELGRAALKQAEDAVAPLDQRMIDRIGPDRVRVATAVLGEMHEMLEQAFADRAPGAEIKNESKEKDKP